MPMYKLCNVLITHALWHLLKAHLFDWGCSA